MQLTDLNLTKTQLSKENVKNATLDVGVYIFWDEKKKPLYVGKSVNLRNRLESYLRNDLHVKTAQMVSLARYFSTISVTSELESLLLESYLVKKNQPKYNIELKDDKSPLYIRITKDEFPAVITARKGDRDNFPKDTYFGPFPSSASVRMVLRLLRRIFPYADHKVARRPCIYSQIKLCNPCPSYIAHLKDPILREQLTNQYKKNISYIKKILSGKMPSIKKEFERVMNEYASREEFEKASEVRAIIDRLNYITQPVNPASYFETNPNLREDLRDRELKELLRIVRLHIPNVTTISRIECFDIAHLGGSHPTASMVTFVEGEANKAYYRHFKIYQKKSRSDVDSLTEVAQRRLKHLEDWGKPDLIIVDGGKPQLGVFLETFQGTGIPICGLAKRFETLVFRVEINGITRFVEYRLPEGGALHLVQRLRDEAHRFARRLHHKLVSKSIKAG